MWLFLANDWSHTDYIYIVSLSIYIDILSIYIYIYHIYRERAYYWFIRMLIMCCGNHIGLWNWLMTYTIPMGGPTVLPNSALLRKWMSLYLSDTYLYLFIYAFDIVLFLNIYSFYLFLTVWSIYKIYYNHIYFIISVSTSHSW